MSSRSNLAMTPASFLEWAERGEELMADIRQVSNHPRDNRILREFNSSEVMELTGTTRAQWTEWSTANIPKQGRGRLMVTLADIHRYQDALGIRPGKPKGAEALTFFVGALKGGSSKTTTTQTLGVGLALRGYRVLLIDADFQATMTRLLGFDPDAVPIDRTIAETYRVSDQGELDLGVPKIEPYETHIDGLDLIPSSIGLAGSDIDFAVSFLQRDKAPQDFHERAKQVIDQIKDGYDVVLIDTAPSFSFGQINLLWAADGMIMPVPPSMPDFSAAISFAELIGGYMGLIERFSQTEKVWDPVILVHTRVDSQRDSVEMIRRMSGNLFQAHRIEEFIPASEAVRNAQVLFRSLYEVTYKETDSRALSKARLHADALVARFDSVLRGAWERQLNPMENEP